MEGFFRLCLHYSVIEISMNSSLAFVKVIISVDYISSVRSLSRVQLFATPWTAVCQTSLFITNPQSLLKLISIELVMSSNHLILCCALLLSLIFPSTRVFSNESVLCIRWLKYWSFLIYTIINVINNIWIMYVVYVCLVAESCLTLCNSRVCSPPVSSVHEILQARILKWVATFSSRESSQPRDRSKVYCISCIGRQILTTSVTWEADIMNM